MTSCVVVALTTVARLAHSAGSPSCQAPNELPISRPNSTVSLVTSALNPVPEIVNSSSGYGLTGDIEAMVNALLLPPPPLLPPPLPLLPPFVPPVEEFFEQAKNRIVIARAEREKIFFIKKLCGCG